MEQKVKLSLGGLSCAHCAAEIEADIGKLPNVTHAEVNLVRQELSAELSDGDTAAFLKTAEHLVHKHEPSVTVALQGGNNTVRLSLAGLSCAHCASEIETDIRKLPNVTSAEVNLVRQELSAELSTGEASDFLQTASLVVHKHEPSVAVSLIEDAKPSVGAAANSTFQKELTQKLWRFGIGIVLFAAAVLTKDNVSFVLYLVAYLAFGYDVIWTAVRNITRGQIFDENFLMSVSTIGAICLREMPEAVFVMLFYQVGETFQEYAVDHSRKSIASLMDIRPDYANLLTTEGMERVDPQTVNVGAAIQVRPGEKVPLDGVIIEGTGQLDTAALTGESLPQEVGPGDAVFSGSLSRNGALTIEVTRPFGESTVVKILEMVENATAKKSKTEQFITRFARIYTPLVVLAAVLLAVLPPFILGEDFSVWIGRALIFLVISCPCALVISVPLGYFSGLGAASRRGILVKGSNYLHALPEVDTVVFDKTGTLTKGIFAVQTIQPAEGITEEMLLRVVVAGERLSTHPIAKAIVAYGAVQLDDIPEANAIEELGGLGIRCQLDGEQVLLGNHSLMERQDIAIEPYKGMGSVVYAAKGDKALGYLVVTDVVRPEAKEAILQLRQAGVRRMAMLTGDSVNNANAVGEALGLDEVYAKLMPQEKVTALEALYQTTEGKILFVGDGINDAPVLARADIGVAMGGIGSDAAIEAADVVIMNDDIGKLAEGIHIARKTNRIVMQNIVLALGVKFVVLGLGAVGMASMWMAVFADVGVTFLAVLNAMRKKA